MEQLKDIAARAYHAQSFDPQGRGARELERLTQVLSADIEEIKQYGATPEETDNYSQRFERFSREYFYKESRCMSSMITGPARFPVRSNEKKQRSVENHLNVFSQWRERAKRAIKRAHTQPQTIADELQMNIDKLAKLEARHEMMKTFNAMMRKGASVQDIAEACKISQHNAQELMKPDFCGRKGFPQFSLTNNLAKIKATRERIAVLSNKTEKQGTQDTYQLDGVRIEINHEADRIQVFHDTKPDAQTIADLKRRAFKWSPTNKCWQRKITANAMSDTKQLFKL